jgi:hypothetical protein
MAALQYGLERSASLPPATGIETRPTLRSAEVAGTLSQLVAGAVLTRGVVLEIRLGGNPCLVDTAAVIVLCLVVILPAVLVGGLFFWAAVKDGQEDKALQAQLGIRRRTRVGR